MVTKVVWCECVLQGTRGGGYTSTAARQSLSGFKVTSHVFARLQYDDANC